MKYVRIIDENGMFIEDAFVEEVSEFTIETPCPSGFYHPKWNGTEWVEGLTQEEIQEIRDSALPTEPTLEEKVAEHDNKIVTLEETVDVLFGGAVIG